MLKARTQRYTRIIKVKNGLSEVEALAVLWGEGGREHVPPPHFLSDCITCTSSCDQIIR